MISNAVFIKIRLIRLSILMVCSLCSWKSTQHEIMSKIHNKNSRSLDQDVFQTEHKL